MPTIKKLTKRQKAVAVAKDVLKQLTSLKLSLTDYVSGSVPKGLPTDDINLDIQPYIDKIAKSCKVCLLGACVLSKARVLDQIKLIDLNEYNKSIYSKCPNLCDLERVDLAQAGSVGLLKDIFDKHQLYMMEAAFIARDTCAPYYDDDAEHDDIDAAVLFGKHYGKSKRSCVTAVMKNIIRNKGEFVVPKLFYDKVNKLNKQEEGLYA